LILLEFGHKLLTKNFKKIGKMKNNLMDKEIVHELLDSYFAMVD
jgi:hypothetical protein